MEERNKRKKKKEGSVQGYVFKVLKYCIQGFEICNVERSSKGEKNKKRESVLGFSFRVFKYWVQGNVEGSLKEGKRKKNKNVHLSRFEKKKKK